MNQRTMRILLILSLIISSTAYGQVSGDIKNAGRKMETVTNFIMAARWDGYAKYDISVNAKGEITSAKLIETDLKSTPALYELKKHVLTLKFAPGTWWPKYHHGVVKMTMSRSIEALGE